MLESLYSYILPIHVAAVLGTLIVVLVADSQATKWLRGTYNTLDPVHMRALHRHVWYGLLLTIITGVLLFYPYREFFLFDVAFQIKMGFVGILMLNAVFIGKLMDISFAKSFKLLTPRDKIKLLISGSLSTLGWVGAFVAALFLGL